MQLYCDSLTAYQRLKTREVKVGDLLLGNLHPIRTQTMTTTDTMDTKATVEQSIRCIEAGAELIRITAPSKKEAENLQLIKKELHRQGYRTPLVADIHFTPNAAEIAARIVEKVRINPGNYIDKKKFEFIEYTDADYLDEIARIRERFTPLVMICKEYGTAMRIGTNHGSLSDRIMSRYGDTPMGMVESAMEFLRVARGEQFHQIMLSMKSSNPQVMVQAYRLLIRHMMDEFGECYPLHLGVTEAGDGEDGRIKSAVGIGTLMEDGIGDTIRVSLTEDPEFEIPVCKDLVKKYSPPAAGQGQSPSFNIPPAITVPYNPFSYCRRPTRPVFNIGGKHVPIVVADFSRTKQIDHQDLASIGYDYEPALDKWTIRDGAADFIYLGQSHLPIALPGSLQVFCDYGSWRQLRDKTNHFPLFEARAYLEADQRSAVLNLVSVDCAKSDAYDFLLPLAGDQTVVMSLHASGAHPILAVRRFIMELMNRAVAMPILLQVDSRAETIEEQLVQFSAETGELLLDGMGDGIWLINEEGSTMGHKVRGRTYLETKSNAQFLNNTAFSILQATRTRISKTEYISCPSCGRTLFDLQLTTARIRSVTNHLKGVKIAIMGCIVNGPGEMADADFGYVGSGPGKITLYRGKEVVKRSINSETAVDELIDLIKESDQWVNP